MIDFGTNVDVFEPPSEEKFSGTTYIISHGAGCSRASFRIHGRAMAERYGHRVILPDMPGHGSRMDEECTAESCVDSIRKVIKDFNIPSKKEQEANGQKTFFMGVSWSSYVGYSLLGELKEYFTGAILESCAVDLAKIYYDLPWRFVTFVVNNLSYQNQNRVLYFRLVTLRNSSRLLDFVETRFGAGIYGKSNPYKCAKDIKLWGCVPKIECPVLFLHAKDDHLGYDRGCQKKILKKLLRKDECEVYVFKNGDHVFSHDMKHFDKFLSVIHEFGERTTLEVRTSTT